MFKRALILSLLGISGVIAAFILVYGSLREEDRAAYKELISLSQNEEKNSAYAFSQQRKGIRKDIYVDDLQGKLHLRIEGKEAELIAQKGENGDSEMVEKMKGVHCLMQEKLYEEKGAFMQMIRVVDAKEAEYHYEKGYFIGQEVEMALYALPGRELKEIDNSSARLLMKGHADAVNFSITQKGLQFNAQNMHGTITMEEGIQ